MDHTFPTHEQALRAVDDTKQARFRAIIELRDMQMRWLDAERLRPELVKVAQLRALNDEDAALVDLTTSSGFDDYSLPPGEDGPNDPWIVDEVPREVRPYLLRAEEAVRAAAEAEKDLTCYRDGARMADHPEGTRGAFVEIKAKAADIDARAAERIRQLRDALTARRPIE